MTPGIQPSNVKIMLRKKLAMRPVISTASGGSTTQKKYRSAFITNPSCSYASSYSSVIGRLTLADFWLLTSELRLRIAAARNLQSLDSTANRGKDDATGIRAPRLVP